MIEGGVSRCRFRESPSPSAMDAPPLGHWRRVIRPPILRYEEYQALVRNGPDAKLTQAIGRGALPGRSVAL